MVNNSFSHIPAERAARAEDARIAAAKLEKERQDEMNDVIAPSIIYRVMVVGVLQELRQALYPGDHTVTNQPPKAILHPDGRYTVEAFWEIGLVTRPYGTDQWDWKVRVQLILENGSIPVAFLCDRFDSVHRYNTLINRLLRRLSPSYAAAEAALITPQIARLDRDDLICALTRLHQDF